MARLFGTDGIRGIANEDLTCELVYKLGQASAHILNRSEGNSTKILIGRDTRISGDMLEAALVAGICSMGADAIVVGVLPTPAIAHLVRAYRCDAGIVISASHNSMEYNGIKVFDKEGYKLSDELEDEIEDLINGGTYDIELPTGDRVGTKTYWHNGGRDYIDHIKGIVDANFVGLRVALDCANGASYSVAPTIFEELGAKVSVIHANSNGIDINANCGSVYPEKLKQFVIDTKSDIGFAFDGDADRLISVDEMGNIIDGDQIMAVCAAELIEQGKLKRNTVVSTVMSNMGFDIAMKEAGCNVVKTQVGDRYVLERMLKDGYNFGGEQSGHIIFLDHNTTGDGTLTAVKLMEIMKRRGKQISELANIMKRFPQILVNVKADEEAKKSYRDDKDIESAIKNVEAKLGGRGRVLIRPSGTEPLIRIMIEGEDQKIIEAYANDLAKLFRQKFKP
ncbi:MAG: phosphoglucosamine mutase [Clostridiales bacterium]|nr:phosphoglucosamine mutase [Clostridiales bacterium]